MRTLKKALCLVLVLSMVMGIGVIGAGAAYSDADQIEYQEAVDVMTAIGVMQGVGENTFDPDGTFTRAQAAKMLAYMMLGEEAAEALPARSDFTDVSADQWFSKYIGYGVNEGFLAGMGDGTFKPDDPVTGYQWAKMLLCALGYDSKTEGFEGVGYEINIAKIALSEKKIFAGNMGADYNQNATREEAALYAFNMIQQSTVYYQDTTTVVINGVEVVIGNGEAKDHGNPETDPTCTFMYKHFNQLKKVGTDSVDDYGRPATKWQWTVDGKTETVAETADTPVATYTGRVSANELYNTLGSDAVIVATKSYATDNSTAANRYYIASGSTISYKTDNYTVSDKDVTIGGNGIITEIYDVDDSSSENTTEYAVVQIRPVIVKLGNPVNTAASATEGAHTTYTISYGGTPIQLVEYTSVVNAKNDKTNFTTDAPLAKDDYVLVYGNADAGYTVAHAEEISGVVSSYNSSTKEYTINGTAYGVSDVFNGASLATTGYSYKETANYVLDANGDIIGTYNPTSADEYLYIASKADAVNVLNGTKLETTYAAKAVMANGSVTEITVSKVDNTTISGDNYTSEIVPGLYTYEIDKNGKYELTTVTPSQTANTTLSGKSPIVASGIYGNASTVYIVMNWTSGTESDYDRVDTTPEPDAYYKLSTPTIITGYANVGELTNVVGAYVDESDPAGVAEVVFIYTNGTAGANADYIYYLGTYTQTSDGYTYDVIVDGVKTTMTDDEITDGITAGTTEAGLMSLTSGTAAPVSTSKQYANGAAQYSTAGMEYTLKNQGGLLYAKSSAEDSTAGLTATSKYICTVGDAVPVYTVSAADGSVTVGTAADLSNEVTANQVALVANSTDDGVAAIWVIVD